MENETESEINFNLEINVCRLQKLRNRLYATFNLYSNPIVTFDQILLY